MKKLNWGCPGIKGILLFVVSMICISLAWQTALVSPPIVSRDISASTVKIETEFGYGSGTIIGKTISPDSGYNTYYVLTAYHLLNGPNRIDQTTSASATFILTSYNKFGEIVALNDGIFVAGDVGIDVLVVSFLSTIDLCVSPITTKYNLMDEVFNCTCQLSDPPSISHGIISRIAGKFIVADAEISPGASGGALFVKRDNQYLLIGAANSVPFKFGFLFTHLSYYVSSKTFVKFLKDNRVPCTIE